MQTNLLPIFLPDTCVLSRLTSLDSLKIEFQLVAGSLIIFQMERDISESVLHLKILEMWMESNIHETGKHANWVILNQKPIHVANLSVVCASKMPIRPILKTYLDSCDDRNVENVHEAFIQRGEYFMDKWPPGKGLQQNLYRMRRQI